ncbi:MAG: thioredoxin domain-containing protein [Candidatus Eisenbacteria bacterium]|uniref:Thioredoxin domain-containing protein n=1 Tax=Eiseniibacteriota bacterium TaxID=2212470 RepID=A0A538U0L7_UNCEI|nr:MAG: thioredoxin domain-containing protein [Candidatus Eisenbacteria bacterium]
MVAPGGDARGRKPNHLVGQKSPYLLQHAYNPVDWRPWGEEAFAEARREDKPIFLSIGYSTCHWCHVMERESFEDDSVAALLNRWFVSIKVDREERPDVDRVYMSAMQAMGIGGGWPLNVFLTPDLRPFFGGTLDHAACRSRARGQPRDRGARGARSSRAASGLHRFLDRPRISRARRVP